MKINSPAKINIAQRRRALPSSVGRAYPLIDALCKVTSAWKQCAEAKRNLEAAGEALGGMPPEMQGLDASLDALVLVEFANERCQKVEHYLDVAAGPATPEFAESG